MSIDDGMPEAFERYLGADVVVYATPLWWYGMSSWMKAFLDRFFCFTTASAPGHDEIRERIVAKKAVLVMSAEERYPASVAGVVHQVQELSRYLHHELVGVVVGVGNSRGEVVRDPADPVARARELGARLADARGTDYRVETVRSNRVWSEVRQYGRQHRERLGVGVVGRGGVADREAAGAVGGVVPERREAVQAEAGRGGAGDDVFLCDVGR